MYQNGNLYLLFSFFLFVYFGYGVGGGQIEAGLTNRTHCSFDPYEGSGEDPDTLLIPDRSAACIPLTADNLETYVYTGCYRFMTQQCFFLNYTVDHASQNSNLLKLDKLLNAATSEFIHGDCKDIIRTFTCAYVYPGCNPTTGLPEGVCEDECIDYISYGDCMESIMTAFELGVQNTYEVVFPIQSLECDDPLQYVVIFDPSFTDSAHDEDNCIKLSDYVDNPSLVDPTNKTAVVPPATAKGTNLTIMAVTVVALGLVVIVVVVVIVALQTRRYKKRRRRQQDAMRSVMNDERRVSLNQYTVPNNVALQLLGQVTSRNRYDYDGLDQYQLTAEDLSMLSEDLRNALIPFEQVKITGDLGEGAFGMVYKGQLAIKGRKIDVAVKTVKSLAYNEMKGFLKESSVMCSFSHPNVLGMEGICLDPESQSPYLILPFMKNGDLKTFLKNKRDLRQKSSEDVYPEGLDHDALLGMCYQIACGMEYLASRKLVHRDLAARNCMIDEALHVKVADFGLTRDIYQQEYYRQSSTGRVPVKWMSPESLSDRISDEKTDVWSFGVTCWEVYSLGRTPYPTLANHEILDYLEQGRRLKKPALCREPFYGIMLLCWKHNPENRPPFETLVKEISALLPENYLAQHVEMPIGSPNEENMYVIMENPMNSAREEESSVASYATPPNSPFLTSDYSVSQQEGSIALSIESCQVDDSFASDSEHSDTESRFAKCVVRNKSSFRTPSSNLTSVSTLVPEYSAEIQTSVSTLVPEPSAEIQTSVSTLVPEHSAEIKTSVSTLVPEHSAEIQIGSMEFLSTVSCLSTALTETLATAESNVYVNHSTGLSAASSRDGSRAGSAFGSYLEMKPADTSHT